MNWRLRGRSGAIDPVDPILPPTPARAPLPESLRALRHGDAIPDGLIPRFEGELLADAIAAGGTTVPTIGLRELTVRLDGMPDWWAAGGNLLLAADDAGPIVPELSFLGQHATNCLAILGRQARIHRLVCMLDGGRVVIGAGVNLWGAAIGLIDVATVMIGDHTTATLDASLDARNGGSIYVGADGMWGSGIRIITDDMHAIRDRATGKRLNKRGGRVVIGAHVWLAETVRIMGSCRIGEGTVVGAGSLVTGRSLPGNSICVGRPARAVRDNIAWSREDEP